MAWNKIALLIDDDELVLRTWAMAAKAKGIQFKAYSDPASWKADLSSVPLGADLFFDSKLGDGTRGEELAKEAHALGFRNLYLATGLPPDAFPSCSWLKGIIAKDPPW